MIVRMIIDHHSHEMLMYPVEYKLYGSGDGHGDSPGFYNTAGKMIGGYFGATDITGNCVMLDTKRIGSIQETSFASKS